MKDLQYPPSYKLSLMRMEQYLWFPPLSVKAFGGRTMGIPFPPAHPPHHILLLPEVLSPLLFALPTKRIPFFQRVSLIRQTPIYPVFRPN